MYYLIFVVPALILSLWAQAQVSGTFKKYSKVGNRGGITGAQAAANLLQSQGISDVRIERISGNLTDHYDPRTRTIRLSDSVYGSTSISAVGVAAHETGHACQHHFGYAPLTFRTAFFPVATFGSNISWPLIMVGFLLGAGGPGIGSFLVFLGIILFSLAVLFQVITLPVEFNASSRALEMVEAGGILSRDETDEARKVLKAAALTYVAAAAVAIGNLIRLILISRRR